MNWDLIWGVCVFSYDFLLFFSIVCSDLGYKNVFYFFYVSDIFLLEEGLFYDSWDMKFKYNKLEWKFIKLF